MNDLVPEALWYVEFWWLMTTRCVGLTIYMSWLLGWVPASRQGLIAHWLRRNKLWLWLTTNWGCDEQQVEVVIDGKTPCVDGQLLRRCEEIWTSWVDEDQKHGHDDWSTKSIVWDEVNEKVNTLKMWETKWFHMVSWWRESKARLRWTVQGWRASKRLGTGTKSLVNND
jgi:hypothetical protein